MSGPEQKTMAQTMAKLLKVFRREMREAGIGADLALVAYTKDQNDQRVTSHAVFRKGEREFVIGALKTSLALLELQRAESQTEDDRTLN